MEIIKTWILGIAAASLISGIAATLTPAGKLRRTVGLVCGFLSVAVMLGPLKDFDFESFASYIVEFNSQSGLYGFSLEGENERLVRVVIEEKCRAYILDKAGLLGIEGADAEITTRTGEGEYPYPYSVRLRGEATEEQKRRLSASIESELGIPAERQSWD